MFKLRHLTEVDLVAKGVFYLALTGPQAGFVDRFHHTDESSFCEVDMKTHLRLIFRGMKPLEGPGEASNSPVLDEHTKKLAAAYRAATKKLHGPGATTCAGCKAAVLNVSFALPDSDLYAHTLTIHDLAYHREDCSPAMLRRIAALPVQPVEPTEAELAPPPEGPKSGTMEADGSEPEPPLSPLVA